MSRAILPTIFIVVAANSYVVTAGDNSEPMTIRVASLSIVPEKWAKAANAKKVERMIYQAAGEGADLVITPEGVLEGYVVNEVIREKDPAKRAQLTQKFMQVAEPIDGPFIQQFRALADELDVYLVLGFLEADGAKTYNAAALFSPQGELVGKYRKTHFAQGYRVNPPGYTPGNDYPVFDIGRLRLGIMICFDRQPPEPARHLTLGGADLIACPSYGGWGEWNTRLMQVRAYENQVYVVFTHPEQSLMIDRDGELIAETGKDSIAIREFPVSGLRKTRSSVRNRRPETYRVSP